MGSKFCYPLWISITIINLFVQLPSGQYMPHRRPHSKLILASANENPFARQYDNQGYYRRFSDYGRQNNNNGLLRKNQKKEKPKPKETSKTFDYFDGKSEESDLDYNDAIEFKDFDPIKFVSEGVNSFFGDFADLKSLEGLEKVENDDNLDYNYFKQN